MSKFVLTSSPTALPGSCRNCGVASNGYIRFVDLNIHEDYTGALYFCETCVSELGRMVDCFHVSSYRNVFEDNKRLVSENAVLKEELRTFKELEDAITSAGFNRTNSTVNAVSVPVAITDSVDGVLTDEEIYSADAELPEPDDREPIVTDGAVEESTGPVTNENLGTVHSDTPSGNQRLSAPTITRPII